MSKVCSITVYQKKKAGHHFCKAQTLSDKNWTNSKLCRSFMSFFPNTLLSYPNKTFVQDGESFNEKANYARVQKALSNQYGAAIRTKDLSFGAAGAGVDREDLARSFPGMHHIYEKKC